MNKRNSIILGLLFGIIVVEILVLAPKDLGLTPAEEVSAPAPAPRDQASGQVMQDVHLVQAKRGAKEWELWADRAVRPAENGEWTIEQVKVKFFAEGGVTYTVTGMKGNVVPNTNDIRIAGKVVTRSSNGYVFKTESVNYDSKARMLKSPEAVQMSQEDRGENTLELTGADMVANLATNEIKVNRNVRAVRAIEGNVGAKRKVNEGKFATILSERAVFSGRSNLAQFFGNVAIDVDSMRVTGPEAKFAYDPKTQQFESVEVGGGIRVTDSDKFATSSSVSVNFKQDKVVFNGGPRVVQNGDELIGDQIVFLEGGRKVEVSNAKAQFDPRILEKKK